MKKIIIPFFIFLLTLSISSCEKKADVVNSDEIVARVNNDILTVNDVKDAFGSYIPYLTEKQKNDYIKDWVETTLMYQAALKEGLDKDPKVKKKIEKMKKIILSGYIQEKIASSVKPITDEEARNYYEAHKEDYNTFVTVSYIIVDTESKADSIKKLLINDAKSFDFVARKISRDNPDNTHVIGPFRFGEEVWLPPEVMREIFNIKIPGKFVGPIPTDIGYIFVELKSRKEFKNKVKYEDVKDEIKEQLQSLRIEKKLKSWMNELKRNSDIEINPDRIGGGN